ncbi:DNA/RNA helicase domain-containing protein [Mycetocola tolaasinivorans]|uniref:DNA/RNA helicase domain-containing protein n=1 Tax=Mycetocola tolaasinivorans TaxID=76635 RepID=UPI00319E2DB6
MRLTPDEVRAWGSRNPLHRNWPVVYVLNDSKRVYVGETLNAASRMRQHMDSDEKRELDRVRIVLNDRFNKSASLDLESFLIRMFSGDGKYQVTNRNDGIVDAEYFDRASYQSSFAELFDELRTQEHLFTRTVPEIINSDLFKLSPFKALTQDQAVAVEDILEGLFTDLENDHDNLVVINGNPGTGKTVVAIYLLKLLRDIQLHDPLEQFDQDSLFSDFFTEGHAELLSGLRVGIVVPQQSLRDSIARVFALTPGLDKGMVLSPFAVGQSSERFDLLIVDEAHRLNQRANQPSGVQNKKFADINTTLFGYDDPTLTQLDWIRRQSTHVILMLDVGQSVRPADLPTHTTEALLKNASSLGRLYRLQTQMRIAADEDYVGYVRSVLSNDSTVPPSSFSDYDLRFFDDLNELRAELVKRDAEHGLARLVAGYAWEWRSRVAPTEFDIDIDGAQLRWNSTAVDWINSANSLNEVGSIHTVQGYDLNYAGVIIGKDLRFDPVANRLFFDRAEYYDKKGRENNKRLGITYTDEDLLRYVQNIYAVLLTRGIAGTYVYVCDPHLRAHLRRYFSNDGCRQA